MISVPKPKAPSSSQTCAAKSVEYNAQIDQDLNYLNRQITNFEKIRSQTIRLMKSIEEQMTLADELMNEGKNKPTESSNNSVNEIPGSQ